MISKDASPATQDLSLPVLKEITCSANVREILVRDFRGFVNFGVERYGMTPEDFLNLDGLKAEEKLKKPQFENGHTDKYLYLVGYSYDKFLLESLGLFSESPDKPLVLSVRNLQFMRTETIALNRELKQLMDNPNERDSMGKPLREDALRLFQILMVQARFLDMFMGKIGIAHLVYGKNRVNIQFSPITQSVPGYRK